MSSQIIPQIDCLTYIHTNCLTECFDFQIYIFYFSRFQNNVYHYRILQDTSRRFLFEVRMME
jgi:hypothetical protein